MKTIFITINAGIHCLLTALSRSVLYYYIMYRNISTQFGHYPSYISYHKAKERLVANLMQFYLKCKNNINVTLI